MGYIKTLAEAKTRPAERAPFTTGTLSAKWVGGYYFVFSYDTEIARVYPDGNGGSNTELNATKYSQTTSKHLNIVKRAWGVN